MKKTISLFAAVVCLALAVSGPVSAQKKILIIGNSFVDHGDFMPQFRQICRSGKKKTLIDMSAKSGTTFQEL